MLIEAQKLGCRFDGWDEHFDYEKWLKAFENCGISPEFYAYRKIEHDEILPWDHIDIGVRKEHLIKEHDLAYKELTTPSCREKCTGCGRCYISCFDGAHQAIDWNEEKRRPKLNDNCVGCHLCLNVCPVQGCITPGEIRWKEGRTQTGITVKKHYE